MRIEELKILLSKDYEQELDSIIEGLSIKKIVSLRINTLKCKKEEILDVLKQNMVDYKEICWYKDALLILNKNEEFLKRLDIYQDGKIYLQSLSSMIPGLVLKPKSLENILDMTAAPGSKTSEISALTGNTALITAIEKNKIRFERLQYNLNKLGVKKVTVLNQDARYMNDYFRFDKILLDAPCSGSGTLLICNGIVNNRFGEQLIEHCCKTQKELIEKAIKLLNVGGELVYSTCSILKQENEDMVTYILASKQMELINIQENWMKKIPQLPTKYKETLCVLPTKEFEGFFVAKFKKIK